MDAIYPLDLPEVKAYLSLRPEDTSQDPFLASCIEQVCGELAPWLPFSIIEREMTRTAILRWTVPHTPVRINLPGPVLAVRRVYATHNDGHTENLATSDWILNGCTVQIGSVPLSASRITVEYRAGSEVPEAVRGALLMMCKARYERRDEDPMTDAVRAVIRPFTESNI